MPLISSSSCSTGTDPSRTSSTESNESNASTASSVSVTSTVPLPPNVHAVVAQRENVDEVISAQLDHMDAHKKYTTADDGASSNGSDFEQVNTAIRRYSADIADLTARQYHDFARHAEEAFYRQVNEDRLDGVKMERSSHK